MKRGHHLPVVTTTRDFAFGLIGKSSENFYPPALTDEIKAREYHVKYVRTHGNYASGEQKKAQLQLVS